MPRKKAYSIIYCVLLVLVGIPTRVGFFCVASVFSEAPGEEPSSSRTRRLEMGGKRGKDNEWLNAFKKGRGKPSFEIVVTCPKSGDRVHITIAACSVFCILCSMPADIHSQDETRLSPSGAPFAAVRVELGFDRVLSLF